MVFSVQQGEHGPLVVYKLEVPDSPTQRPVTLGQPTTVVIDSTNTPSTKSPRLSPLEPTILGTVVMPAEAAETSAGHPTANPALNGRSIPPVPDRSTVVRIVEDLRNSQTMVNEQTGGALTLENVNEAVLWRRDTAEKLRQVPLAPRF